MLVLGFLIALLVEFLLRRRAVRRYIAYGAVFGAFIIVLDAAIVLAMPDILKITPIYVLIPIDIVSFGKIALCTCMGMYCCAALNGPDFPLVKHLLGRPDARPRGRFVSGALATAAVVAGTAGFSWLLFKATSPRISELLQNLTQWKQASAGVGATNGVAEVLVGVAFGTGEELLFRLGMQNYLALRLGLRDRRYWIAVLVTAAVWTLGHANVLEPEWVKLVQIFPVGVALGFLFRRYGVESCIVAHCGFNTVLFVFGTGWISA
jgi:membrane protease YdiL (CAAX protease family)